jgi:hypothetical protein
MRSVLRRRERRRQGPGGLIPDNAKAGQARGGPHCRCVRLFEPVAGTAASRGDASGKGCITMVSKPPDSDSRRRGTE